MRKSRELNVPGCKGNTAASALFRNELCCRLRIFEGSFSQGIYKAVCYGNALPANVVSALSVGLYGMFLAIIIPPARKSRVVAGLVAVSFFLSFICSYLPGISTLSDGTRTILLTVLISCAGAILFPVKTEEENADVQ